MRRACATPDLDVLLVERASRSARSCPRGGAGAAGISSLPMSCSIAPTPRSCISSSLKPKQRPISSEMIADVHRVHRRLVAGALGQHADAQVLLADHLVDDRARQRLGLRARLLRLGGHEVERLAAGCAPPRVLARAALLGVALARELARRARPGRAAPHGRRRRRRCRRPAARRGRCRSASASPRPESLAASPATGSGPGSVSSPAPTSACWVRSLCCGLQRTVRRPSERIVASCAGVVMRKLLSGNGCDIQPMSRWTNMPTRSAWTSI